MHAELQVLSPLVPVREVNFLRFCKQHAEGVWAVVDVSIDNVRETSGAPTYANCRRLPSGCVVQDMPNGYSKVNFHLPTYIYGILYVCTGYAVKKTTVEIEFQN
jgi:homeobox-leucine zipper protein